MRVKTWPRLTVAGRTAYFLGLFAAGFGFKLDERGLLMLGLCLIGVVGWTMAATRRQLLRLSVRLDRPSVVRALQPSSLRIHLDSPRHIGALFIREGVRTGRLMKLLVGPVLAGQRLTVRTHEVHTRRGHHATRPLRFTAMRPLGLARAEVALGGGESMTVLPALLSLRGKRYDLGRQPSPRLAHRSRRRGNSPQIHRLRVYRPGDPMRMVHWRSTARQNQLIVREGEEEAQGRVWLGLCTGIGRSAVELATAELAISMAATLAHRWSKAGVHVDLVIGEAETPITIRPGSRTQVLAADLALARVDARLPLPALPDEPMPGYARHVLVTAGPLPIDQRPGHIEVIDVGEAQVKAELRRARAAA